MAKENHVKKCRVECIDRNGDTIKRGQEYWWWQFPYQERINSATQPKRSDLVQSSYKKKLYDLEDELERGKMDFSGVMLGNFNRMMRNRIGIFRDSLKAKLSNMPAHLRTVKNGKLLSARIIFLTKWMEKL